MTDTHRDETAQDHTTPSEHTDTDHELMVRCRERDEAAFDALADRYREPLRRHIAVTVHQDRAATDDILQDVLLRVWLRADTWDGRGAVKAWLFRIATNTALNHLRGLQRRRETALLPGASPSAETEEDERLPAWMIDQAALAPDTLAVQAEDQRRMRRLIDTLPEEKREVLRLVVEEERDVREAAATLGIPEGTVKSRLFHARKQIARFWADENEGE